MTQHSKNSLMRTFNLGGIHVRCLQDLDTLQLFEIQAEEINLGPGLHVHEQMEESFYVVERQVFFVVDGKEQTLEKGNSLSVLRKTPHSWKTAKKNTHMLLFFSPAYNQFGYFEELEKCYQSGRSWDESIAELASRFDNTPVSFL